MNGDGSGMPFVDTCDDCFFCNERCREEYEDRYRDDVYSYCPSCEEKGEWQKGTGEILWNREGKRVALSPVYRHPSLPGLFLYRGMSIADPPTSLLNFQIYHESSGRLLAWTQGDEDIGRVQASMLRRLGGIDWTRNLENFWLNGVALDDKAEKAITLFNAEWGVWAY